MKPSMVVVTLGVDDLSRAVAFYRDGLGLSTKGVMGQGLEHGAVAFFSLVPGVKLGLWPRESLAHDSGVDATGGGGYSLGINLVSKEEVDEILAKAEQAGGCVIKEAQETFWGGYAGYFRDLDGHLWEVVWNPFQDEL